MDVDSDNCSSDGASASSTTSVRSTRSIVSYVEYSTDSTEKNSDFSVPSENPDSEEELSEDLLSEPKKKNTARTNSEVLNTFSKEFIDNDEAEKSLVPFDVSNFPQETVSTIPTKTRTKKSGVKTRKREELRRRPAKVPKLRLQDLPASWLPRKGFFMERKIMLDLRNAIFKQDFEEAIKAFKNVVQIDNRPKFSGEKDIVSDCCIYQLGISILEFLENEFQDSEELQRHKESFIRSMLSSRIMPEDCLQVFMSNFAIISKSLEHEQNKLKIINLLQKEISKMKKILMKMTIRRNVKANYDKMKHITTAQSTLKVLEIFVRYLSWELVNKTPDDGLILLDEIVEAVFIIPKNRLGIDLLHMCVSELFGALKDNSNFDISAIHKWNEITKEERFIKFKVDVDFEEKERQEEHYMMKIAVDRNCIEHVKLARYYVEIKKYAMATKILHKFLSFGENYKIVEGWELFETCLQFDEGKTIMNKKKGLFSSPNEYFHYWIVSLQRSLSKNNQEEDKILNILQNLKI